MLGPVPPVVPPLSAISAKASLFLGFSLCLNKGWGLISDILRCCDISLRPGKRAGPERKGWGLQMSLSCLRWENLSSEVEEEPGPWRGGECGAIGGVKSQIHRDQGVWKP